MTRTKTVNAETNLSFEKLETERLKAAMGSFATGVTVVATHLDGVDYSMTCNSFNTVSLDPPMVLWSIRKASGSRDAFANAGGYTVSLLSAKQTDIAMQCTRGTPQERLDGIATTRLDSERVIIDGASAWFDCEIDQIISAGDHDILIGKVIAFQSADAEPMVYVRGQFTQAK